MHRFFSHGRRSSVPFCGLALLIIAANSCTSDAATDPGYYLIKPGSGKLLDSTQTADSTTRFMLASGCLSVSGAARPLPFG